MKRYRVTLTEVYEMVVECDDDATEEEAIEAMQAYASSSWNAYEPEWTVAELPAKEKDK